MTLSRFDKETASAILAEAILSRGSAIRSKRATDFASEIDDLLSEVREQLSLKRDDMSKEAAGAIENRLSREIHQIIMGGVDEKEVIGELGSKGQLPLSAYKIKYDSNALKDFRETAKTVKSVISSPDDIQHFIGSGRLNAFVKGSTLLTKWVPSTEGEAHWLLVVSQRDGEDLAVQAVLRVSPTRIVLEEARTPLDMLKAFTEVYGWDFTVLGISGTHRFMVDTEVLGPPDEFKRDLVKHTRIVKYIETGYNMVETDPTTGKVVLEDKRIVLAFSVDMTSYLREKPEA